MKRSVSRPRRPDPILIPLLQLAKYLGQITLMVCLRIPPLPLRVAALGLICTAGHLIALTSPAWTIEIMSDKEGHSSMGLFEYYSSFGQITMVNDYGFCKYYVPMAYAWEKCLSWRLAQALSLMSIFLAYTGLYLFILCALDVIRLTSLDNMYHNACAMCGIASFNGLLGALAWKALEHFITQEHNEKKTGVQAGAGYAFYLALATSLSYVLIPLVTRQQDNFSAGRVVRSLLPSSVLGSRVKRSRSSNSAAGDGMGVEYKDEMPIR